MKKLKFPICDLGYYLLLIDIALSRDDPNQLEMDFSSGRSVKKENKSIYLKRLTPRKANIK